MADCGDSRSSKLENNVINKILVVDDSEPERVNLQSIVADAGYRVLTATSGAEAVEKAKTERPDLIFLDIHLPKISGIDFLKTLPQPPHVILTTAFSNYALESYELNVVDYLLKPFSFQRFVKAISKVPSGSGHPAEH